VVAAIVKVGLFVSFVFDFIVAVNPVTVPVTVPIVALTLVPPLYAITLVSILLAKACGSLVAAKVCDSFVRITVYAGSPCGPVAPLSITGIVIVSTLLASVGEPV
jgi:hypothetical protein